MMNILFYVDPLIEMGRPYFKKGWIERCINIIDTLKKAQNGTDYNFAIILNEPLNEKLKIDENIETIVLTQSELLKPFEKGNYLDATLAWHQEKYTKEQLNYYIKMIQTNLGVEPDIVISFSPVPFLKKAYPNALVLHHEYSIFSRAPYPESWYFDITGMGGSAYLSKYWSEIDKIFKFGDEEKALFPYSF